MFKEAIIAGLKKHVKGEIKLEMPPEGLGDYAFPCFVLAKELKKKPAQIAEELAGKIKIDFLEKVQAEGPYVNFYIKTDAIAGRIIPQVLIEKDEYGGKDVGDGKNVVIDYSSPNIGKPFHVGHLRSTIIGQSLYLIHKFLGYNVIRVNHLGDWGLQYGKLIYAHLTWGNDKQLKKEPIKYLLDIYVKFGEEAKKNPEINEEAKKWFKKLEDGDEKANEFWEIFRKYSLEEFQRIYKLFNVEFDSYNGEAFYFDKMQPVLKELKKKKLSEIDDGALIIPFDDMPPMILVKSDGATTYALRDLAAVKFRLENYDPAKILYVVGTEQQLHFKQLFSAVGMLKWKPCELMHVMFGMYLGKDGKKMATREGKVLLLDEIIKSTIDKARKLIEEKNPKLTNKDEVARQVGVGAVFFGDLMNDRIKDIVYDWDKILDFEGDTGPYLQYTYARASSIVRKAGIKPGDFEAKALATPQEAKLVRLLMLFGGKVEDALAQYKPHVIAQYCLELSRAFNEFYHSCPCVNEPDKAKKLARLSLIEATRQVLKNGLALLNIEAPSEM
ncbi:arginine--tRNA ligase [Candidatus Woesearchaeota archaeon]|nr:arginine--tRNA ligase [Candidatus Woesearchaeota archaeon]